MSDDDRKETTPPTPAVPPPPSEFAYPTIGTEKVLDRGINPDPAEDRDE
ncbi:hypothetical protein [Amycolatopsis orientalis]|nr:hypothetical protein [Amycolatopsis orientalis]